MVLRRSHRVSIQHNTPTVSSRGDRVDAWVEIAKVWANVAPLNGREFYLAQQVNSEITTRITIGYRSGITAKQHRVVYGSQTYDIVSPPINPEMRNRDLVLMCKEVT